MRHFVNSFVKLLRFFRHLLRFSVLFHALHLPGIFRRYLKTVTKEELQRILKVNPDYYHEMAPYALALGVDQIFAKRFERLHQPNCTYLHTSTENNRTAAEWDALLRKVVDTLNERQKRLRFERFFR